jgi:uncharacterized membrane protein
MRFLISLFDPHHDGPLLPSRHDLATFAIYVACALLYVSIGVWKVDFLLSFWTAGVYLLLTAWLVPAGLRRLA